MTIYTVEIHGIAFRNSGLGNYKDKSQNFKNKPPFHFNYILCKGVMYIEPLLLICASPLCLRVTKSMVPALNSKA